ncbi:MAG: TIGR04211 family SH3 domain-containing protein [Acidiferrobacteraceae bacterium]|jgi:SH3 domain protein
MKRSFMVLVLALLAGVAHAETVYITDQLYVSLRPAQNNDGPPIKTERTGTALQVLGRDNGFVQVKDPSGDQGWIADRYLTSEPPARVKLDGLALKLDEMQAQLVKAESARKAAEAEVQQVKQAQATAMSPETKSTIVWLLVAFAMLVVGFVAGVIWLREVNRKKLGGMYLRI